MWICDLNKQGQQRSNYENSSLKTLNYEQLLFTENEEPINQTASKLTPYIYQTP